jgi:F0F1-type ATP synthase membrane subunit c/vacuolar-type H+-ATPase subunit K
VSTPIQYRPASSNAPAQGWLTFLLTMLCGLVILGTALGIGGTISRMARAWRESVSPLG